MLKVSRLPSGEPEIFRSLQGEGASIGAPAVFLRLATCNLACTWCDTRYTWDWQNHDYEREVVSLPVDEVERRVMQLGHSRLVITGGEPLMQQETLATLASALKRRGYACEVETNGTLVPRPEMVEAVAQWNVSPKTGSSGNRRERREVPRALAAFRELDTAYFKFVVVEPSDVDEVCRLVERRRIPWQRVILMPEGVTPRTVQARSRWLARECTERGFRFSPRLHIMLWGDERGR
jgi:organic radical activating enzyme